MVVYLKVHSTRASKRPLAVPGANRSLFDAGKMLLLRDNVTIALTSRSHQDYYKQCEAGVKHVSRFLVRGTNIQITMSTV